jgi:hypothetical protein
MSIFRFVLASFISFIALSCVAQLTPNTFLRSFNAEVNSVEVDENRGLAYFAGEFSTYAGSRNGGEIFNENTMRPSYILPWVPYVDITVDDGEGGWIIATHYFEGVDESGTQNYQFIQIHPDGTTLYFASRGHIGLGGSDLFMSRKDAKGNWGKPVNLGYPINTRFDENSLLVSAQLSGVLPVSGTASNSTMA